MTHDDKGSEMKDILLDAELDQLIAGLDDRDPRAIRKARKTILLMGLKGSAAMLAGVFRGMLKHKTGNPS